QQRKLALWWGSVKSRGDLICASQRSCCVVVLFAMGASVIPARAIDCFWTGATTNEWTITPGLKATSVRAFDNIESRKGYSGLYQFGAAYNPGEFTEGMSRFVLNI